MHSLNLICDLDCGFLVWWMCLVGLVVFFCCWVFCVFFFPLGFCLVFFLLLLSSLDGAFSNNFCFNYSFESGHKKWYAFFFFKHKCEQYAFSVWMWWNTGSGTSESFHLKILTSSEPVFNFLTNFTYFVWCWCLHDCSFGYNVIMKDRSNSFCRILVYPLSFSF